MSLKSELDALLDAAPAPRKPPSTEGALLTPTPQAEPDALVLIVRCQTCQTCGDVHHATEDQLFLRRGANYHVTRQDLMFFSHLSREIKWIDVSIRMCMSCFAKEG